MAGAGGGEADISLLVTGKHKLNLTWIFEMSQTEIWMIVSAAYIFEAIIRYAVVRVSDV